MPKVSIAALTSPKVNPSNRLLLTGTVGPDVLDLDWEWALSSGALADGSLGDQASTSLTGTVTAACSSSGCDDDNAVASTAYLVLPSGTITPGATSVICYHTRAAN